MLFLTDASAQTRADIQRAEAAVKVAETARDTADASLKQAAQRVSGLMEKLLSERVPWTEIKQATLPYQITCDEAWIAKEKAQLTVYSRSLELLEAQRKFLPTSHYYQGREMVIEFMEGSRKAIAQREKELEEMVLRQAQLTSKQKAQGNAAGGDCQANLSYLSTTLFAYPHPELLATRMEVLKTDIRSVISQAASQGFSTSQTARALLEQAKEFDRTVATAREAVFAAAGQQYQATIAATLRAIDQNQALPASAPELGVGMTGNAVKLYIVAHWGRLANKEVAVQVACFANR
jgi:hypothetical protein